MILRLLSIHTNLLLVVVICAAALVHVIHAAHFGDFFLGKGMDITKSTLTPETTEELYATWSNPRIISSNQVDSYVSYLVPSNEIQFTAEANIEFQAQASLALNAMVTPSIGFGSLGIATEINSKFFADVYAKGNIYISTLAKLIARKLFINRGAINPQFLSDMNALPENYTLNTAPLYSAFIAKYGTHIVRSVCMVVLFF